ncbi:MAG TPA: VWA domain-containing protein [Candidatus Dormibacteraeota bacterium]|nr:VWA domain-containing protein [Candidatus Dormibacteraeota bacterium]
MRSLKKIAKVCLAASVTSMLAVPATPQERAGQGPTGPTIKTQVNLVNLFATVRDKNKRIVGDLKKEDFKIFEDNQPQDIAFFSKEVTLPITLALLLDTSGSETEMLGAIQETGSAFLSRILRKGDEALVMSFDTDVDLLSDFTDDRGQLERAVRRARINTSFSGGMINPGPIPNSHPVGTALYDAIYLACGEKLNTEAGRKAIVIVTDADDQGSKVRIEEAIEAAQRSDTVIHILLVADPHYGGANVGAAKKLTEETGGRMISVKSEKKLMEAFDEISAELRGQYTLGYYPTNSMRDGKFRKIKVDMANHDLKVLARRGYYAPRG